MKTFVKRCISILLLIIAIGLTAHELQDIFFNFVGSETQRLKAFYLEDKDSLDMVVMGSSEINLGYSAPLVYKETSLTSYPYCFSINPVPLWKYELTDIERYQSPQVIVVEINGAVYSDDKSIHSKGAFYKLSQCMPLSINKYHLVSDRSPQGDSVISNMFPFVRYHSKWDEVLDNNFYRERLLIKNRGYSVLKGAESPLDNSTITFDAEYPMDNLTETLNSDGEAALRDFLETCKTAKTPNILFIQYPHLMVSDKSYSRHKRYNRAGEIIKEYGFEYIDFSAMANEIGINSEKYFYDSEHMNAYGQKKFSSYLGQYVKEKYDLQPIQLTDKQKKEWAECEDYIDSYYKYYDDFRKKHGDAVEPGTPNIRESIKYTKLLKDYD